MTDFISFIHSFTWTNGDELREKKNTYCNGHCIDDLDLYSKRPV